MNVRRRLRVALTILLVSYIINSATSCPEACRCAQDKVDCSRKFLLEVPVGIPKTTRILDLSNNEISYLDPEYFEGFENLENLDLSNNVIRSFEPKLLGNFPKLKLLTIRKNRLTNLPKGVSHSKNIEKVDLRSNLISNLTLSELDELAQISHVDLSRNLLVDWPVGRLERPATIIRLDLTGNLLRAISSDSFTSLRSLIWLRISKNKIHILEKDAFKALPFLEHLDVTRNSIRSLPSLAFNDLPSLKNIFLSRNDISKLDDGVFYGCDSLLSLNLSSNRINHISKEHLFELHQLRTLDLSHNHIMSFNPLAWAQVRNLKYLSLHANRIQSLPSAAFKHLSNLETLILSGNSIENVHKTAMAGLDRLYRLDLSSNTLAVCVEDGAVLYNTSMPYLKQLKFTNNQLRIIPNRAFDRFPALEELDLSDNPIASIHSGAFEPLRLKSLKLSTNSVLCDCHMKWFADWLFESKLDRSRVSAKCAHPPQLGGIDVLAIDTGNLTCSEDSPRARVVSQSLTDVKALVGETANLHCSAYGQAPISIEWRLISGENPRVLSTDQTTLMNTNRSRVINGTMNGQELAAGELTLLDVTPEDRASYQCVVRNRFSTDFGKPIFLDVQMAPKFTNPPANMSLLVGQNAKIMCAATGMPPPSMKWAKDGGQTFPAATERRLHVRPQDDHLYFLNVTLDDAGIYTCYASNDAGTIQAHAFLNIYKNKFHSPLTDMTVEVGETVILDCLVDLDVELQKIVWMRDDKPLTMSDFSQEGLNLKADGQILVIHKALPSDTAIYSCELWVGQDFLAQQTARVIVGSSTELSNHVDKLKEPETLSSKFLRFKRENLISDVAISCLLLIISIVSIVCVSIGIISLLRMSFGVFKRRQNAPITPV